jgi:hypothetical protein
VEKKERKVMEQSSGASIHSSGNADVDVTVQIDTSPLAYALACFLHATDRINSEQFSRMVRDLDSLGLRGKIEENKQEVMGKQRQSVKNEVKFARTFVGKLKGKKR